MSKIYLPNNLDDDGAISLIRDLNYHIDENDVSINFDHLSFARPFGTLVAAEAFKQFVAYRKSRGLPTYYENDELLRAKSKGAISYLKYFGFFKYCGINIGDAENKAYHTNTYLPIQSLCQHDLEQNSKNGDWRNTIVKKCEELGELLTSDLSEIDYLEYSFREIIRNVFEHSGINECVLMAQAYKPDLIEIAVADRGCGIHSTIQPKYGTDEPIDSILLALEPGISMADISNSPGEWGNSGFGLYILSNVGKEYGTFSILSNCCYLRMYQDDKKILTDELFYKGTAIKLLVHKKELEYFPNLRKRLIDEGEQEYYKKYGERISASKRSGMSLN
ncbi:hypothetical protein [Spirochaeta dissipatitropha]